MLRKTSMRRSRNLKYIELKNNKVVTGEGGMIICILILEWEA